MINKSFSFNYFQLVLVLLLLVHLCQRIDGTYFEKIKTCKVTKAGFEYIGSINKSKSGTPCTEWSKPILSHFGLNELDFSDKNILITKNNCRNPKQLFDRPWCVVKDSTSMELCDIPACESDYNDCKDTNMGQEYTGSVSVTASNRKCQFWASQTPQSHQLKIESFPDVSFSDLGNKCRNPDKTPSGPWCYTMDTGKRWETCSIPICESEPTQTDFSSSKVDVRDHEGDRTLDLTKLYFNATVIIRMNSNLWTPDVQQKTTAWSTAYYTLCQKNLDHYDACLPVEITEKANTVSIVFLCKKPLMTLRLMTPLRMADYSFEWRKGPLYEINNPLSEDFAQYRRSFNLRMANIPETIQKFPALKNSGFFHLLFDNAYPYAVSDRDEVVAVISQVGQGTIGLLASDQYLSKEYEPHLQDFYSRIFKDKNVSSTTLDKGLVHKMTKNRRKKMHWKMNVVWNTHNQIGITECKALLKLVKSGLNIVMAIKPWAYHFYIKKLMDSEAKTIFIESGVWPSLSYSSQNLRTLRSSEIPSMPLVSLLDYANANQSYAMEAAEAIEQRLYGVKLDTVLLKTSISRIQRKFNVLYSTYKDLVKSLVPCWDRFIDKTDDKKILKFMNLILLYSVRSPLVAPGANFYPGIGNFDTKDKIKVKISMNLMISKEVYQLGLYLLPGDELKISGKFLRSEACIIHINHHLLDTSRSSKWYKWPYVKTFFLLKPGIKETVSFAFGGLLSVSCTSDNDEIELHISGAYRVPYYDRRNNNCSSEWTHLKEIQSPWVILAGDSFVFTVPSLVLRNLGDPSHILKLWDTLVKEEKHLRGIMIPNSHREIITADAQVMAGYMHSGYPVGTQMYYVCNPSKKGYLFSVEILRQTGQWGVSHEIGHNLQQTNFMFNCNRDVANNIFSLITRETITGKSSWSPEIDWSIGVIPKIVNHIKTGNFSTMCGDYFVSLGTYAQLRAHFGWELFRQVFRHYDNPVVTRMSLDDNEKIQLWINVTSFYAKMNLSPFYELWKWPVDDKTKESIKSFPMFLPNDFLTKQVEDVVNEIIAKYRGQNISREALPIPETIGPLKDPLIIEGKFHINYLQILK